MKRWGFCLGLVAVLPALAFPLSPAAGRADAAVDPVRVGRWLQTTVSDFSSGTFRSTVVSPTGDGEVRLLEKAKEGAYTSTESELPFPCRAAGLLYKARLPQGTRLTFELRGRAVAGQWTPWVEVPAGPWTDSAGRAAGEALATLPVESRSLQYRVSFVAGADVPALEEIVLVYLQAEAKPAVQATPGWRQPDGLPRPIPPAGWGALPGRPGSGVGGRAPARVEVRPAALALSGCPDAGPLLRMLQRFHRDGLGFDDLAYSFLVDQQGGVYQGRLDPMGDLLYIGVLGAHPHEPISPTVEDALVALLDWLEATGRVAAGTTLLTPADRLLAERLRARQQAGNLRRDAWVLARGGTSTVQHEWILVANLDPVKTLVAWDLFLQDGRVVQGTFSAPGESRSSLFVNPLVGEGVFWSQLRSSGDMLVERALYYGRDADDSVGLEGLSQEWYLPGGRQEAGFTTTLTLLNPGDQVVTATVSVFGPSGLVAGKVVPLGVRARLDLPVSDLYSGTAPVGWRVKATAPIAAEQGVRFGGQGGYALPGSPLLSRDWLFAGVETESPFTTVLALLNPGDRAAGITLTLMSEDGTTLRRLYTVQPGEQVLDLNSLLPELALAARVQAGRPIAAARVTFFNEALSAHASLGAVRPARRWYLAEGSTGEPFETLLMLANPNDVSAGVEVALLGAQGVLGEFSLAMPAHSRLTVPLGKVLPNTSAFSTRVEADWPVVVERAMYLHGRAGGHASLGVPR